MFPQPSLRPLTPRLQHRHGRASTTHVALTRGRSSSSPSEFCLMAGLQPTLPELRALLLVKRSKAFSKPLETRGEQPLANAPSGAEAGARTHSSAPVGSLHSAGLFPGKPLCRAHEAMREATGQVAPAPSLSITAAQPPASSLSSAPSSVQAGLNQPGSETQSPQLQRQSYSSLC